MTLAESPARTMPATTASNAPEVTVSELSAALRRTVEDAYGYVRVRGEISNYKGPHASGHAYFCLKDEGARIDAVIWRSSFQRLRFKPQDGLEIVATGRLTTFPGKSSYQIVIEALEPAGAGALMALLDERRRKLAAEGVFDQARKRPLPYLPRVVGVVTSPTGAVIRDILHRLADRFPRRVLVWPVRVQGETSAGEVAAAIRGFNALQAGGAIPRPDVLIVARGGGSLEDLWGFNEEIVVRAAAESAIPLVSAVGHETDTTLIDLAADRRAPTPSAAAEIVVPVRTELLAGVATQSGRLVRALGRHVERRRTELRSAARALPSADALLAASRQRLDTAAARLAPALVGEARAKRIAYAQAAGRLHPGALRDRTLRCRERSSALADRAGRALEANRRGWRQRFESAETRLKPRLPMRQVEDGRRRAEQLWSLVEAYSYEGVLKRGFAMVLDRERAPVRSAGEVAPGAQLTVKFHDGEAAVTAHSTGPRAPLRKRRTTASDRSQTDLFG